MDERWKKIDKFPDYEISNLGNIRRINPDSFNRNMKILNPQVKKNGYLEINLFKNRKGYFLSLHRLVLETFDPVENMNILQVNHKKGIKSDNRLKELEWMTCSENHKHAFKNKLRTHIGINNPRSKLNVKKVVEIKKLLLNGEKVKKISEKFYVSKSAIYDIRSGRNWKEIKIDEGIING